MLRKMAGTQKTHTTVAALMALLGAAEQEELRQLFAKSTVTSTWPDKAVRSLLSTPGAEAKPDGGSSMVTD